MTNILFITANKQLELLQQNIQLDYIVISNNLHINTYQSLYTYKLNNTYTKILYYTDTDSLNYNLKYIIKDTMNFTCDGLFINCTNTDNNSLSNTLNIISLLPSPYNFEWSFILNNSYIELNEFSYQKFNIINKNTISLFYSKLNNFNNHTLYPTSTYIKPKLPILSCNLSIEYLF
jgi:hypothetical protein